MIPPGQTPWIRPFRRCDLLWRREDRVSVFQLRRGGCASPHLLPCCELSKLHGDSFGRARQDSPCSFSGLRLSRRGSFRERELRPVSVCRTSACSQCDSGSWSHCTCSAGLLCVTHKWLLARWCMQKQLTSLRSSSVGCLESHPVELYPTVPHSGETKHSDSTSLLTGRAV